jgi:sulfotransferase
MQQIHFISGLPRSGSTLLSVQNPKIHAGMSSLVLMAVGQINAGSNFNAFFDNSANAIAPIQNK